MNGKNLVLSVEDEGAGIDPETKEAIFSRFYRGEGAKKISPDGLGLSLYIANEFARLHGGELRVDNRKDNKHGACFTLSIPIE